MEQVGKNWLPWLITFALPAAAERTHPGNLEVGQVREPASFRKARPIRPVSVDDQKVKVCGNSGGECRRPQVWAIWLETG